MATDDVTSLLGFSYISHPTLTRVICVTAAAALVKAGPGPGSNDNEDGTSAPAHAHASSLCTDFERTVLYPWVIRGYARAMDSARARASYTATNAASSYAPAPTPSPAAEGHGRGSLATKIQRLNRNPSSHHHHHHRRHNRPASVVSVVYTPLSKDRDEGDDSSTSGGSVKDWGSGGSGERNGTPIYADDLVPRGSGFNGEEHMVHTVPPPLSYTRPTPHPFTATPLHIHSF